MPLYEIDQSMESLIDPETGELLDYEAFAKLQMEREAKLENMALWIKDLRAKAEGIKAEKKKLEDRQRAAENKAKRLTEYLALALNGQKFETARVEVSYRKSAAVEVSDQGAAIDWLSANGYDDRLQYAAPTISKTDLKDLIQSGVAVPGAEIVERRNIQIK